MSNQASHYRAPPLPRPQYLDQQSGVALAYNQNQRQQSQPLSSSISSNPSNPNLDPHLNPHTLNQRPDWSALANHSHPGFQAQGNPNQLNRNPNFNLNSNTNDSHAIPLDATLMVEQHDTKPDLNKKSALTSAGGTGSRVNSNGSGSTGGSSSSGGDATATASASVFQSGLGIPSAIGEQKTASASGKRKERIHYSCESLEISRCSVQFSSVQFQLHFVLGSMQYSNDTIRMMRHDITKDVSSSLYHCMSF